MLLSFIAFAETCEIKGDLGILSVSPCTAISTEPEFTQVLSFTPVLAGDYDIYFIYPMDLESAKVSESVITTAKFKRDTDSYYPLTVSLKAGETYQQKWIYKVPKESEKGKFNIRIKPHGLSMDEVIGKSTELYLDPWWDSSYRTQAIITFSCPAVGCEDNIAAPVFFTSASLTMADMKAGGADLRYIVNCSGVNTQRNLFISDFNSGLNATVWLNYTNQTGCSHHLYYNNSVATPASSPYGVFYDYDNFSSFNATKWTVSGSNSSALPCMTGWCAVNYSTGQHNIYRAVSNYPMTVYTQMSQKSSYNKVYGFGTNFSSTNLRYGYYISDAGVGGFTADYVSNRTYSDTTFNVQALTTAPNLLYLYRLKVDSVNMNLSRQTTNDNALVSNSWTDIHRTLTTYFPIGGTGDIFLGQSGSATDNEVRIWWFGYTNGTRAPQATAFAESGLNASKALMNVSLGNYGTSSNFTGFYVDIKNSTTNLTKYSGTSQMITFWDIDCPLGLTNITAWVPSMAYNFTPNIFIENGTGSLPYQFKQLWSWPNILFNASNSTSGAAISSWGASFINNATWATISMMTTNGTILIPLNNFTPFGVWDIYANASGFWNRHESVNLSASYLLNYTINFTSPPQLVICNSSTPVILNYTYINETGSNSISQTQVITFTVWSPSRDNPTNFSLNFSSLNWYHEVCLWPGTAFPFRLDSFQIYGGNGSNDRNYFLYDVLVSSNAAQVIPLYNLPAAQTQLMQVSLRDASGIPVSRAFIHFQRYYPASNQYKTIAETLTDAAGFSNVYIMVNDPFYQITTLSGSSILYTFPSQKITCDPLTEPCRLSLNIPSSGLAQYWEYYGRLAHYCEVINATPSYVKCYYTDSSGIANWVSLECKKLGITAMTTVCSQMNYSSAGSLICPIANTSGAYSCYLSAKFGTNSTYNIIDEISLYYSKVSALGGEIGLFITVMLVGTLSLAGAVHPVSSILLAVLMLGGAWVMGLLNVSFAAIIALAVVGGILIYKMSRS